MPSLKHDEAVARHDLLTVTSYDVDLDLTRGEEIFGSRATIRFKCARPGSSSFFEVDPRTLRSVSLNGRDLPVEELRDGRFPLAELEADNELTVVADMGYSRDGEGLHRFTDPEDGLTYTYMMGFLDMASRVFACFEQPDLKAPYRLRVTAPEDWTVVANEAGTHLGGGRWEFVETKPLSTYFVTLVAGPYVSVYRDHDGVRFGLHARQSFRKALTDDEDEIFKITFGTWDRLHELYGVRYPFGETYDQCFVPEFNAGAMENPGCVTFRDERFLYRSAETESLRELRAMVVAHEMAHMWFGDLVTMRWWDDLWLNESFANCMGYRASAEGTRFVGARANGVIGGLSAYRADERPSTHPVSSTVAESGAALSNFDAISYHKGGAILDQLAAALGDEVFFTGLRDYFAKYRFGNATLTDLMDCLSAASGRDLGDWSQLWLRTTGPNTLRLRCESRDGRYTKVEIEQSASDEHPTLRPHHVRIGVYRRDGDRVLRAQQVAIDVSGDRVRVPQLEGVEIAELLLLNDDAVTYAKLRLDDDSFAALSETLNGLEDSVARALLWTMLIDMVRDGELSVSDYLDMLLATLPSERRDAAVEQQLAFAQRAVARFLPESEYASGQRRLAELAGAVRHAAPSGGGLQLAALRAEIAALRQAEDIAWLRRMLDGEQVPEGVTVDADLRWRIVLRLTVVGEATEEQIAAELERDSSSEGHKYAATCRSALPTAEAKQQAWQTVMTDTTLSNHLLVAVATGFWWPEQTELTREYVSRFFTEAVARLSSRTPWEQMRLTDALFPHLAIGESTMERAETASRDDSVHSLVRRVLVDAGADMREAWRARGGRLGSARDGGGLANASCRRHGRHLRSYPPRASSRRVDGGRPLWSRRDGVRAHRPFLAQGRQPDQRP